MNKGGNMKLKIIDYKNVPVERLREVNRILEKIKTKVLRK